MSADENDRARAEKLFREFHEREPRGNEISRVAMDGDEWGLQVGTLYGLIYKTKDERKPYIHRFNVNDRPLLYVSSDGRAAFILKGGFRFNAKGFNG